MSNANPNSRGAGRDSSGPYCLRHGWKPGEKRRHRIVRRAKRRQTCCDALGQKCVHRNFDELSQEMERANQQKHYGQKFAARQKALHKWRSVLEN
jgi:hypothetical protein